MEALADATGSVISAVLFGALAGSGALPFPRTAFEAAIRRGQVGVEQQPRGVRRRLRGGAGWRTARSRAAIAAERDAPRRIARVAARGGARFSGDARAVAAGHRTAARLSGRRLRARLSGAARALAGDRAAARRRLRPPAGRNRAAARARHVLRGHRPGGRPQNPREPLRSACATKRRSRTGRSSRSPSSFIRARRRSPTRCRPGSDAGCMRTGWARGLVDRRPARDGRQDHVGQRLRPALPALAAQAAAPPLAALRGRAGCARRRWLDLVAETARGPTTRSRCRSRACATWSKATATPMSAGGPSSTGWWRSCPACGNMRVWRASLANLIKAALADEEGIGLDRSDRSAPERPGQGAGQVAKVQAAHLACEGPWWVAPHLAGSGEARIFRWTRRAVPAEGQCSRSIHSAGQLRPQQGFAVVLAIGIVPIVKRAHVCLH